MGKKRTIFLGILFLCILLFSYWFFLIKKEKCETEECFKENLLNCKKADYQKEEKFVFDYNILGKKDDSCVVEVKLVFAAGEPKFSRLLGKSMKCYLPLNYFGFPEKEIDFCSGPLKEEIGYLMIKESYTYISQNLGKP
ncbi:MAG: hypothetical protein QXX68_00705 [Candidatus Pacearchaeota archaeon]